MKIRCEVFISELQSIVKDLSSAIQLVSDPATVETTLDGLGAHHTFSKFYPNGVPGWVKVEDLDGVDIEELRAELLLAAGKLEVLASL